MKNRFSFSLVAGVLAFSALSAYAAKPFGLHGRMKVASRESVTSAMGIAPKGGSRSAVKRVRPVPSKQMPTLAQVNPSDARELVTSAGANLYGYLNHTCDYAHSQGWYQFLADGITKIWSDPLLTDDKHNCGKLQTSWVRDGRLCGYDNLWLYGYLWGQTYHEIDLSTGLVMTSDDDEDCIWEGGIFLSACYDSEENVVYGYAYDDYQSEKITDGLFQKAASYPFGYEVIKEIGSSQYNTMCMAMAYNPADKGVYGITLDLDLVKIDKQTGDQTKIAHLDSNAGQYNSGMCYSATQNKWLWNPVYSDTASALVSIDPATGAIANVLEFTAGGDVFGCLAEIGDDSPTSPTIESVNFADGATSGTITIGMPSILSDGTPIEDELEWYAKVDGVSYSNGSAAPGQKIDVAFSNLSSGSHTFAFHVVYDGVGSAESSTSLYVGYDCPAQPRDVVLAADNVRWSAVETGTNGGAVNTDDLVYDVYIDEALVATTSQTYYGTEVGKGKPYALHQASVVAKTGNLTSDAGVSNKLAAGEAWALPYNLVATADAYRLCQVFANDGDTDGGTYWNVDPNRDAAAFYAGKADGERGDGWIILPPCNFPDKDRTYSLYVTAMRENEDNSDAHLEVCVGASPDPSAMSRVVIEDFVPQCCGYAVYGNPTFMVSEAGTYYIGLHAKTGVGNCGVSVHEVRVENNDFNADSPSAVTNLKAVAGASGALNATVSFNMPTTTVNGTALPADASLTAGVTGTETVEVSGLPGEAVSVVVPTAQGDNTISVVCIYDGKPGESNTVDVYTGVSIPGYVKDMTVEVGEDMLSCKMAWSAPGPYFMGYVDPETVDYYLITFGQNGDMNADYIGTGINEYTYTMGWGARQDLYRIGIQARNVAGNSGAYMAFTVVMGTPYGLPMADDFEEDDFLQSPWVQYDEGNVEWFLYPIKDIAAGWGNLPGVALCGVGDIDTDDESTIALPRFFTKGQDEVKFVITSWTGRQAADTSVLVSTHGMTEPETVGFLGYTDSDDISMWKTHEFTLPVSCLEKAWVQLSLNSRFGKDRNYVIIDEVAVRGNNDTGVLAVWNAQGSIFGGMGNVSIKGYEGQTGAIYTIDGKAVAKFKMTSDEKTVDVAAGIYVVKVGEKSVKLIVR